MNAGSLGDLVHQDGGGSLFGFRKRARAHNNRGAAQIDVMRRRGRGKQPKMEQKQDASGHW